MDLDGNTDWAESGDLIEVHRRNPQGGDWQRVKVPATAAAAAAVAGLAAKTKVTNCIASAVASNPYTLAAATGVTVSVSGAHNAALTSATNPGIGATFWYAVNGWALVQDPAGLKFSNNLQCTKDGYGNYQFLGGIEFCTDAPLIEIQVGQPYNSKVRFLVTDESGTKLAGGVIDLAPYNSVSSYLAVNFAGVAKRRKLTILSQGVSGNYWSFAVAPPYSLQQPALGPRLCIIGDSNTCGVGATVNFTGWSEQVAFSLGLVPDNLAHAATGYLYDYNNEGNTYRGRLAVDVFPKEYGAILIQSSTNDSGFTPAQIAVEAQILWSALRTRYPNAPIVVTGILGVSGVDQSSWENALAAQFTAWADANSLWIPIHRKFTGAGSVAAPSGTGNCDLYRLDTGPHLSQAGHDYVAAIVTEAIRSWLT